MHLERLAGCTVPDPGALKTSKSVVSGLYKGSGKFRRRDGHTYG